MALTVDRPLYTAAFLNTLHANFITRLAEIVPTQHRATVLAWTLEEGDDRAVNILTPEDLRIVLAIRLLVEGIGVPVTAHLLPYGDGLRMLVLDTGSGDYSRWERGLGVPNPIRGWVDMRQPRVGGVAVHTVTELAWTDAEWDSDGSIIMSFQTDILALLDGLTLRKWIRGVRTTLPAFTPSGAGVGKRLTANANGALDAQDGITLVAADRFLYRPTPADTHTGLYYIVQAGSAGTPWIAERVLDADESGQVFRGIRVKVREGTVYGGTLWEMRTTGAITVDTTVQDWQMVGDWGNPTDAIVGPFSGTVNIGDAHYGKVVEIDNASPVTVALPAATGRRGFHFWLKVRGGGSAVTIDPNASETLDGVASPPTMAAWNAKHLVCDGVGWLTVGNNP